MNETNKTVIIRRKVETEKSKGKEDDEEEGVGRGRGGSQVRQPGDSGFSRYFILHL